MSNPYPSELRNLLACLDGEAADAIESEVLECKAWDGDPRNRDSQVRAIRETVVCLANARGGVILVGIADRKRTRREAIHGVGDLDAMELRRRIYDGTEPHVLVEIDEMPEPEGRILAIRVPRGIPPHTTSEGVGRIRVGKECKPLTGGDLSRLLLAGGQRDLTAESLPGASIADLDPEPMDLLTTILASEGRKPDLARRPPAEVLTHLGLVRNGDVTLAGVLLLGRPAALARWAPRHEIHFLRFQRETRYDVRHDLRGPLLSDLDTLRRLFEAHLRVAPVQADLFSELHIPELTWWAAREAVLNAVVHRDYFLQQSVHVEVHADRVVVTSPGGFIGGVTPENVLRHPPVRRNPLLADVLQTVGLVNRAGLGVDRIYEELLTLGKGMPRYEADEAHVRLSLPTVTHEPFARFVAVELREGRRLELDDLILLRAVADRGELDRWSAAKALQDSEDAGAQRLTSLRERGYLQPRGRGRGVSYRLRHGLSDLLRGPRATDLSLPIDLEALRLRLLAVLAERGRLTNAEIRRLSGFSRGEVVRLMRMMREAGEVRLVGRGRGAFYQLAGRNGAAAEARIGGIESD